MFQCLKSFYEIPSKLIDSTDVWTMWLFRESDEDAAFVDLISDLDSAHKLTIWPAVPLQICPR